MLGKKDISNKQRMAIELTAILLVGGAVLWTKATLSQQVTPNYQPANAIRTQRIEVVDKDGNTRLMLGQKGENDGVTIYDKAGNARMYVGLDNSSNPALALYDSKQVQLLTLQLSGGSEHFPESASIRLANSDGYPLLFAKADNNLATITLNKMGSLKPVSGLGDTGTLSVTGRSVVKTITILPNQNRSGGK